MARILTEGFEGNTLYGLPDYYTVGSAGVTGTSRYPGASYCGYTNSGTARLGFHLTNILNGPTAEIHYRAGHQFNANPGSSSLGGKIIIRNAADEYLLSIRWDGELTDIAAYTGEEHTGGTLIAQASGVKFPATGWQLIRFHYKCDSVSGIFKLWMNDQLIIDFTGDTNPLAYDEEIDELYWAHTGSNWHGIDDLAINDTTGTTDNSGPIPDGQVRTIVPNANGDVTQMDGSDGNQTNNFQLVDELPPGTGTTDYVQTNVSGNYDLYNLATIALQTGETILGVRVWGIFQQLIADVTLEAQVGIKSNSTEDWGPSRTLTYNTWRTVSHSLGGINPTTGVAWTQDDLDALQAGPKRV